MKISLFVPKLQTISPFAAPGKIPFFLLCQVGDLHFMVVKPLAVGYSSEGDQSPGQAAAAPGASGYGGGLLPSLSVTGGCRKALSFPPVIRHLVDRQIDTSHLSAWILGSQIFIVSDRKSVV